MTDIPQATIEEAKAYVDRQDENSCALLAEMRVLSKNTAIIQTQEGRHFANWLARWAENEISGQITTPPISTHNA